MLYYIWNGWTGYGVTSPADSKYDVRIRCVLDSSNQTTFNPNLASILHQNYASDVLSKLMARLPHQVQIKLSARFPGKKLKNVLQYKFKSRTNSACMNTNVFHKAFFSFMRNLIQSHICRHSEVV